MVFVQSKNHEKRDEQQYCLEFLLGTHKAVAQDLDEVEWIKELFSSTTATRQGIIVEEERLDSDELLLLSRSLSYCRVSGNTVFGLIINYYFSADLSTREKPKEKDKSMIEKNRRVTDQQNA